MLLENEYDQSFPWDDIFLRLAFTADASSRRHESANCQITSDVSFLLLLLPIATGAKFVSEANEAMPDAESIFT